MLKKQEKRLNKYIKRLVFGKIKFRVYLRWNDYYSDY